MNKFTGVKVYPRISKPMQIIYSIASLGKIIEC
jgi:hypothetical protein